jgi:hypothetical protein
VNKSIGKQLIGNYLLIIVLILLATGAILSVSLKQYYLDNVKNNLERESRLAHPVSLIFFHVSYQLIIIFL